MEFYYHELDGSVLILSADGGLNADTAASFVSQLESLIEFGVKKIIIDCTKLTYISSYGIGVLVRLHNKLAKLGGDVKIAAAPSRVLQALNLVRLGSIFELYPDVNQARLAFREPAK
jgi:anti-sigma B factor antagonist